MSKTDAENTESEALLNSMNKLNITTKVSNKFDLYRKAAESNERKLKEAQFVINELQENIHMRKKVEINLRQQLESAENRLIQLHKTLSQFLNVAVRQRKNEEKSENIEQKLNQLYEKIEEFRNKSKEVFECTTNEINLIKKNQELKISLEKVEVSYDLFKIEHQGLVKKKTEMETQFQQRVNIFETELALSRQELDEMKTKYDATVLIYKKQIDDLEAAIRGYEKERQSLLEDFEFPEQPESLRKEGNKIIYSDSTVPLNMDESFSVDPVEDTNKNMSISAKSPETLPSIKRTTVFQNGTSTNVKSQNKKIRFKTLSQVESGRHGGRQKPPLEFLSKEKPSGQTPPVLPIKRRLFSTNCNHYFI